MSSNKYVHICCRIEMSNNLYTGWRRLIGSPRLQIIFHKRATKYTSLLRKMTYTDNESYESWPPCKMSCFYHHLEIRDMTYAHVHMNTMSCPYHHMDITYAHGHMNTKSCPYHHMNITYHVHMNTPHVITYLMTWLRMTWAEDMIRISIWWYDVVQ